MNSCKMGDLGRTTISRRIGSRAGLLAALALVGCDRMVPPVLAPLPPGAGSQSAAARVNGAVGTPASQGLAQMVTGTQPRGPAAAGAAGPGLYTLDFAEMDIREVVAQVLGTMLGVSYTIDPGVHGTVDLHTAKPLARDQLLATLQSVLAANGAALVANNGMMRVVPSAAAGSAGSRVVALQYASAEELAKVLQPLAGANAKVGADPALNALILSGDAGQVQALNELVGTFDVDVLAGQSYALLPVPTGSVRDFAEALQQGFRGNGGAALTGLVRVAPLQKLGAVLVFASQPRYIEAARRIYAMVDRERRATVRGWRVIYLQNSAAEDIAYTLQMAFTPNNVTAVPKSQQGGGRAEMLQSSLGHGSSGISSSGGASGSGGAASGGSTMSGGISGGSAGGASSSASGPGAIRVGAAAPATLASASANPLLGGLDSSGGGADPGDTMRVLPDPQNNALLIYGTREEADTVEAMLRKIDILPMQVRIDATIAEVTLTDALKYGTQFFFKSGGINGILNTGSGALGSPVSTVLNTSFPGFVLSGSGQGGAPFALQALQAVTTVKVLSSPQLLVVDNQPARLQVGALVPYLSATAQSTVTAGAPVVNSVNYQPTGVIMDVTPRVNSGGLVTLDITQEVSDIDTTSAKGSNIDSPTFQQRIVSSRVVVQDGQTIGIGGLIRDNLSTSNEGLPWLKDIPLIGVLAGQQDNERTRTELLVMLTPHVVRSQQESHALTEELRDALHNAAALPAEMRKIAPSGSDDPNAAVRAKIKRDMNDQIDDVQHRIDRLDN
jgi:general secretion pathway protein D